MVQRLESLFAEVTGVDHAIAVSSGTTALVAAIQALDLEQGAEVITSPFTFVATLNAILEAGAVARFADLGPDFNLDPTIVADAVGPRTAAIVPVHLYGYPADMTQIEPMAAARGVPIVEDAAQAIGSTVAGRPVGSYGQGCFSLYGTKNITTGEGGVVTTNSDALADRLRLLRNQGMRARYEYEIVGHNYRMTDLQAAVGVAQMGRLDEVTESRQHNAALLNAGLGQIEGIVLPEVSMERTHVYHQYTIRVTAQARLTRDALAAKLAQAGIGTGIYYPNVVFDYPSYRDHPGVITAPMPLAELAASEVLSLPVHPAVTDADIDYIVENIRGQLA